MIKADGKFFLGRDIESEDNFFYDPDDLTTHAVVVGMTGSGKTGLCIDLLEEAALNKLPALLIDPKGDITNMLLHFPDLLPEDFKPWVNPDEARRENISVEEAAANTAELWSNGHADWGIDKERRTALKESAQFTVYTPGSEAGIPISILSSLKVPELPWEGNQEILRGRITGTVTALLGLVGMHDLDPVQSQEHILLSNIFEHAWSNSLDLDLSELILQVQNPPFEKLGVFDLETFYPSKDRFKLAMTLNNILAAPAFQTWITGQPLDIQNLLYMEDGKPRHSVFYIAHLNDEERMFFVTLLYSAVETWMRAQSGSTTLKALVYFDEIFGYLPPISNPPSKSLILRMLKQARAFGVGQVLVTQNPVDIDYKGISNIGTWFIGKLQTTQDKDRLLDGLEGAASGGLNRSTYDKLISGLGKRQFLAHNVHEKKPMVFYTRWAMNYLAGPLTRTKIPALNELAGVEAPQESADRPKKAKAPAAAKAATTTAAGDIQGSQTRPAAPAGIQEYFLPNNLTVSEAGKLVNQPLPSGTKSEGLLYRAQLIAQADILFNNRKYDLNTQQKFTALVAEVDKRGVVKWEEFGMESIDPDGLDAEPGSDARFAMLESPLNDDKMFKSLQSDFVDYLYRDAKLSVFASEELKLYGAPPTSKEDFAKQVAEAVEKAQAEEIKKVEAKFKTKIKSIQTKMQREERELAEDEAELNARRMEEMGTHLEGVLGMLAGRKSSTRLSKSLSKRRMTSKAKADIEESLEVIEELEQELEELTIEIEEAVDEVEEKWAAVRDEIEEIEVSPYKKDILVEVFGVAWVPYHVIEQDGKQMELPAFSAA